MTGVIVFALMLMADSGRQVTLALPHAMGAGETVWVEVRLGVLSRSDEVDLRTAAGKFLGTISPFGIRSGREAGVYTLPVPPEALENGQLKIIISVEGYGHAPRPPDAAEVKKIALRLMNAGRGQTAPHEH